jgi:hypothetical protein
MVKRSVVQSQIGLLVTDIAPAYPSARAPSFLEWAFRCEPSEFCIYRTHPLVLIPVRFWGGRRTTTLWVFLLLFLLPAIVTALLGQTFVSHASATSDLQELFSWGSALHRKDARLPLLRDYVFIGIAVLMAVHVAHMVQQWSRVNRLPHLLRAAGLIPRSAVDDATYDEILVRNERRFNSLLLEALAIAAAIAAAGGIAAAVSKGMYPGFDKSLPRHAVQHYNHAWLSWHTHHAAFVVVITTYAFWVYMMIRHALMGIVVLFFVSDFQGHARKVGAAWFGYETVWEEVGGALREIRMAVNDIIVSVILGVGALILGSLMVTFSDPVVIALLLFYTLYAPTLIFAPVYLMNRQLFFSTDVLRSQSLRRWRTAVAAAERSGKGLTSRVWLDAELAKQEYDQAVALPQCIVSVWDVWRNVVLYVVPVLALVWALIGQ